MNAYLDIDTSADDLAIAQHVIGVRPMYRNFKPSNFKRFRLGCAKVRAQSDYATIAFIGDSTTRGVTNSAGNQQAKGSYPAQLAEILNPTWMPTQWRSIFGGGSAGDPATADDDRLSLTGSFVIYTSASRSVGGYLYRADAAGALNFVAGNIDTIDVYYVQNSGLGTFGVGVDGGANISTVSTAGAASVQKASFSTTLGNHTVNVNRVSGGIFIIGVEAYNSASKFVKIWNFGWPGAKASDVIDAGQPYAFLPTLQALRPDLLVVDLGINHWAQSLNPETFESDMASFINAMTPISDIILKTPTPSKIAAASLDVQRQFVDAMHRLSLNYDLPLIDFWRTLGAAEDYGDMYDDNLHPNKIGYAAIADAVRYGLMLAV